MTLPVTLFQSSPKTVPRLLHEIRASSLQGISALSHFSQHLFMTLKGTKRAGFDGNSLLQQIQDHFTHGVDLIGIGVLYEFLSFMAIGLFENAVQERRLSA